MAADCIPCVSLSVMEDVMIAVKNKMLAQKDNMTTNVVNMDINLYDEEP